MMKKVEAVIRPERLQRVQDALDEIGVSGLTVTEVLGCGAQRGYTETYRGTPVKISLQRKVKVEAVMTDERVDGAVEALVAAARTGEVGDGKIFILPVDDAIRIRSGERGDTIVEHRDPQHWGH
jgi:nitrogen regulatory protein P-II 1